MDKDKLIDVKQTFALWCALTAARSSPKCRFSNDEGIDIARNSSLLCYRTLDKLLKRIALPASEFSPSKCHPNKFDPNNFPLNRFDDLHADIRKELIKAAKEKITNKKMKFTHGVAAKFINVYFKAMFLNDVSDGCSDQQKIINAFHPPIDRVLLKTLAKKKVGDLEKFWREKANKGWSNFSSDDYEDVIRHIKYVTKGRLWEIEEYWKIDDKDDKDDNNPKQRCL